ncbi:MAG: glycosyltransferase [Streptosporangiales bacterium]|nr:glycosyltransferase [Streptosporangiales bacterium]
MRQRVLRSSRTILGLAVLAVAVVYLSRVVDAEVVGRVARAVLADPLGLAGAMGCYAVAFVLRARAWTAVLTRLGLGQAWAAIHVSLLGNHLLPFRLGEALRVTSVLRRTDLPAGPVLASTFTLRAAELLAVVLLAVVAVPGLAVGLVGGWTVAIGLVLAAAAGVGLAWLRRLARSHTGIRLPLGTVAVTAVLAWVLEAAVLFEIARVSGLPLSPFEAVAVTAVTIAAQTVAVTPSGVGSYEAAATAALVALGADPGAAFGVALATHAVKTVYSLVAGAPALVVPAPGYFGRLRLPRRVPARPDPWPVEDDAPVVAFCPVHNEEATVGEVLRRLPDRVCGRPVVRLVVDDGSTDASAARAEEAGAGVVRHPRNVGLGAALRSGLAEAVGYRPAAVVYLDSDGEYLPEDIELLAAPVLSGAADYVVGSRFGGEIRRMLPHRRLGNRVLTWWVRRLARRRDIGDGQSGYRAFSPRAAAHAEVIHDYNYAQVLTLDLLAKGYRYAEVPIRYASRESGTSFVRLGRYLRMVVPAVYRELNAPDPPPPRSMLWGPEPDKSTPAT